MASLRFTPAVPRETPPSSHLRWPPFHRWWQIQGKDAALSASRLLCAGASLFYRCGGYWGEINHFLRGARYVHFLVNAKFHCAFHCASRGRVMQSAYVPAGYVPACHLERLQFLQ